MLKPDDRGIPRGEYLVTLDLERVLEYADPNETLAAFAARVIDEFRTRGNVAWTINLAHVGERA